MFNIVSVFIYVTTTLWGPLCMYVQNIYVHMHIYSAYIGIHIGFVLLMLRVFCLLTNEFLFQLAPDCYSDIFNETLNSVRVYFGGLPRFFFPFILKKSVSCLVYLFLQEEINFQQVRPGSLPDRSRRSGQTPKTVADGLIAPSSRQ